MATTCAQRLGGNFIRTVTREPSVFVRSVRSLPQQAPTLSLLKSLAAHSAQPKAVNPVGVQKRYFSQSPLAMLEGKMQALVYEAQHKPTVQERPVPQIREVDDAIVRMKYSTICGTDLHILSGEVPTCKPGTILGHEGVGVIEKLGDAVQGFKVGDTVLISCVSKCGACGECSRSIPSHCHTGGWILGNQIDGTQAEYVRLPHAAASMYHIPPSIDTASALTLSDAFPTAMEAGTINGRVAPGKTVAVIGAGPVGLSVVMTAKIYTPSELVVIDLDDNRLQQAKDMGATNTANPKKMSAEEILNKFTEGRGFDCVIEAVGNVHTFELAQQLIAVGGDFANLGVHGAPVSLHLDNLWDRNMCFRTKLVDATSIPTLIKLAEKRLINPAALISHVFKWSEIDKAYEVFSNAAENKALKVRIDFPDKPKNH
ncbi:hypothetical protein KEM54_002450 [Ascosphaera aggregata]|nr:hypothetical protein KEM54_002450 [Ascosphaera aggregata]